MRKTTFGAAFAIACIGATCASATGPRVDERHSFGEFGVGGWAQNFSAKGPASGGVSLAIGATNRVAEFPANPVRRELTITQARHRLILLGVDADCVFTPSIGAGARWRPGCK